MFRNHSLSSFSEAYSICPTEPTQFNVHQSSIDNIVNGRMGNPGVVNLHKMASSLNMTLAEFLDFKELNDFSFEDNEE